LQKVTVPADGAGLPVTEAVRVTSVGFDTDHATDDEESMSVVLVGNGAASEVVAKIHVIVSADSNNLRMKRRGDAIRLQAEEDTFLIQTVLGSHFIFDLSLHKVTFP
jgi:hypothetical protein